MNEEEFVVLEEKICLWQPIGCIGLNIRKLRGNIQHQLKKSPMV